MRTKGFGSLAPQPIGPSGQLGKEQTLPDAEDLFSRYGVGFGQSDSAPHGTCSVGVELLEYVQEQDSGTTETVSEAPGAFGGCGGSHDAGAAPYGTRVQTSGNFMSGPWRDAEVLGYLPKEVVITSARVPSTRDAYALKWNLFIEWCSSHREDTRKCPIRVVLSFLQQGLERRLSPSTLKVYVAAIAANHDPVEVGGEA